MERINNGNHNAEPTESATIAELLPRYYEAHGENPRYETVRALPIAGHDVAWMRHTGKVEYDMTGRGQEGKEYEGRELHCSCHFTQGVGWDENTEKEQVYSLSGAEQKCTYKKTAEFLRQQELRKEYIEMFKREDQHFFSEDQIIAEHIDEIILNLIEKDKEGEFIGEGNSGAHFWGGHFYLQTVHRITGVDMQYIWKAVDEMLKDKRIQLEGMVVQEYYEAPEPTWSEYGRYTIDSMIIVAELPTHSKMPQNWRYSVMDENETVLVSNLPGAGLLHSIDFGVDVDDVAQAEAEMNELAELVKTKRSEGLLTRDELIQRDTTRDTNIE